MTRVKQKLTRISYLKLDFFDGFSTDGLVSMINWSYDMAVIMVFSEREKRRLYRPVKFIESRSLLMGFSAIERDTPLHSIYCFPTDQDKALFGTAVSGKICGPSRLGQDIDPSIHPELKMVQFEMTGAQGCSGAPLFTQDCLVMGFWLSNIGDVKFGVLVESISEWLQSIYNTKETSINTLVVKVASMYSRNLKQMDLKES